MKIPNHSVSVHLYIKAGDWYKNMSCGLRTAGRNAGPDNSIRLIFLHMPIFSCDMSFKAEPGDFKVFVGTNSEDLKEAMFALK